MVAAVRAARAAPPSLYWVHTVLRTALLYRTAPNSAMQVFTAATTSWGTVSITNQHNGRPVQSVLVLDCYGKLLEQGYRLSSRLPPRAAREMPGVAGEMTTVPSLGPRLERHSSTTVLWHQVYTSLGKTQKTQSKYLFDYSLDS